MEQNKNQEVRNAIMLGILCAISYLAVYFARNILSVVTPQMVEGGLYTEEYIGKATSFYFVFYAFGQLINGFIGDHIKAKYMLCGGLLFAGITNSMFAHMGANSDYALIAYGMTGFFLAMIYGPMTKVVAESMDLKYATRCSLGYTFASLLGSPVAGVVAMFLSWQPVFDVGSISLIVTAIVCFIFFIAFEKKGIVKYNQYRRAKGTQGGVKILFKHHIVKFTLVSMLTGIVRTSVVFWMPTYFTNYLGYSPNDSAMIFTIASLVISTASFISVFVYERLGRKMNKTLLIMFVLSTLSFALTYFVPAKIPNIALLSLAVLTGNGAATMLWSIYCPSLRDTGMTSSATGFLDFASYIAAAISSLVFGNAVNVIGWGNLILVWVGLMFCGVLVALPYDRIFKKNITEDKKVEV